jgi:hypothetical protein
MIQRRSFEPFAALRQNRVQGSPSMAPNQMLALGQNKALLVPRSTLFCQ